MPCCGDSVVDPHHFDVKPDSDFYLMRIQIRLFTLIRILIRIQILASNKGSNPRKSAKIGSYSIHLACHLQINADPVPDPAHHFDADPGYQNDADPCGCGSGSTTPCGDIYLNVDLE
jgi:hypothetical protein